MFESAISHAREAITAKRINLKSWHLAGSLASLHVKTLCICWPLASSAHTSPYAKEKLIIRTTKNLNKGRLSDKRCCTTWNIPEWCEGFPKVFFRLSMQQHISCKLMLAERGRHGVFTNFTSGDNHRRNAGGMSGASSMAMSDGSSKSSGSEGGDS